MFAVVLTIVELVVGLVIYCLRLGDFVFADFWVFISVLTLSRCFCFVVLFSGGLFCVFDYYVCFMLLNVLLSGCASLMRLFCNCLLFDLMVSWCGLVF